MGATTARRTATTSTRQKDGGLTANPENQVPPTGEMRLGRVLLLCVFVGIALLLRAWGLDHGLPNLTVRPDEDRIIGPAAAVVRQGVFEPSTLVYPSLLIYLDAAVLATVGALRVILGWSQDLGGLFESWPTLPYRICRSVSVVAGSATVLVAHGLGRALGLGERGGAVAAMVVATNYLHVRDSHWATADAALTFFISLTLLLSIRALGGRSSFLVWSSVVAGLAASTKYQGVLALACPLAAGLMTARGARDGVRRCAIVCLLAGLVFSLTSPYQVRRWREVAHTVSQGRQDVLSRRGEKAYSVHARLTLPTGFGWPVLIAAGLGASSALRRRDRRSAVLLAFAVPWTLSIANAGWVFPRYVTPLVPVVAAWAAQGLFVVGVGTPLRLAIGLVLLCAPGLAHARELDRVLAQPDTRLLAAQWIDQHLSGRARVLTCTPWGQVVFDRRRSRGFRCEASSPPLDWGQVIVLPSHPYLGHFVAVSQGLRDDVAARGQLLARFDPFRPGGAAETEFYPGDAFFVPFRGLRGVDRGGPVLEVWSLRRDDPALYRRLPPPPP